MKGLNFGMWAMEEGGACISDDLRLKAVPMGPIEAIGFDLFNTLITVERETLNEAMDRLTQSLIKSGVPLEIESFRTAYRAAARQFLEETRRDGKETHNRFWISAALQEFGHPLQPDDFRIAEAVEAYFSAFYDRCHLIPDTQEMLKRVKDQYRLGLLSNFTHAPAAREIIDRVGLAPFFDVVLISGDLGYRKPHPLVFRRLVRELCVEKDRVLFIGDDLDPDIHGARRAGLKPALTTYARDHRVAFAPGVVGKDDVMPNGNVPRISTWQDLFSLLDLH